jgi:hypothetical protein
LADPTAPCEGFCAVGPKDASAIRSPWPALALAFARSSAFQALDTAAAHGITALDAIRVAIEGKPWLPPLPVIN